MAFTLAKRPGFVELPDSDLAAEKIAQGRHFISILENAKFATVRPELFVTQHENGDVVPLPTSPIDRYKYARTELLYLWEWAISVKVSSDQSEAKPSGPGSIQWFDMIVNASTGEVTTKVNYRTNDGSISTLTDDGKIWVFTIGIRGKGKLSLASAPTFTDMADTDWDLDSPELTAIMTQLNANAKHAVVRHEVIEMGEFGNGETVLQPVSPIDGYTYAYTETDFVSCWRWSPAKATGIASGNGQLTRWAKSINAANGAVTTTVTYDGGSTTDGKLKVVAFCTRSAPAALTGAIDFVDTDDSKFFPGKKLLDADAVQLNQTVKFADLRPEFFETSHAHGAAVTLPTSGPDSYAYARAELNYIWTLADTGPPSKAGSIIVVLTEIKPSNGVVRIDQLYTLSGGTITNDGSLDVLTLGSRSKVIDTDQAPPDPGGGGGTASPPTTELPNPSFESWSPGATVADEWSSAITGDATHSRQAGMHGLFSQGIVVNTAGAGNSARVWSRPIIVDAGGKYFWSSMARATVPASGLWIRLRFLDSNLATARHIDIQANVTLGTTIRRERVFITIPVANDTTVVTSAGTKTIQGGTLTYNPAFVELEFWYAEPNATGRFDFDGNNWIQIEPDEGRWDDGGGPISTDKVVTGSLLDGAVTAVKRVEGVINQHVALNSLWNAWMAGDAAFTGQPTVPSGTGAANWTRNADSGSLPTIDTATGEIILNPVTTSGHRNQVRQLRQWGFVGAPGEDFIISVQVKWTSATQPNGNFEIIMRGHDGTAGTGATRTQTVAGSALSQIYQTVVLKSTFPTDGTNLIQWQARFANLSSTNAGFTIRRPMFARAIDTPRYTGTMNRDAYSRQVTGGGGGGSAGDPPGEGKCDPICS